MIANVLEQPATQSSLLLNSQQMAEFVSTGMLRFDGIIPEDICQGALAEIDQKMYNDVYRFAGIPLDEMWPDQAAGEALRHPVVAGAIKSLVGANPRFDHMAAHRIGAHEGRGPNLHQDAEFDPRFTSFDIQISMFFHDVPAEMGGTLFVPGSHLRRVRERAPRRYHYICGQQQTVCTAGTVVFWHPNLFHAGRSNLTDRMRYMFKVRLNPRVKQVRLWDCSDLDDPRISQRLSTMQPWMGGEVRTELINRIRLWRSLSDQPQFDIHSYMGRIESNYPTNELA